MFRISVKLGYVLILSLIYEINSLIRIPLPVDNDIITTETAIRKTMNRLFGNLRFNNKTKKIIESNIVHNYFTSLTLQDYNTLQNVDSISRVSKGNVNVTDYVNVLNEILDENVEGNKTEPVNEGITKIESILKVINQYSKEMKTNDESKDINAEIISLLKRDTAVETNNTNAIDDNSLLSDNEFWEPSGRRIYRGRLTKIKYFPFMAVIQFFGKFTCAGSIIKSDLIITAASCLQLAYNNRFFRENPSFLSVRVGSTFYQGGGEVIPVLEVYFHPRYNPKNLRHNLCLIRLVRRLRFRRKSRRVKKIDFDRTPSGLPMTTDGITVVGWGAQDSSNIIHEPWKNRIAFATLDIYPARECQEIYSEEYVTRYNFCAGFMSKGGGACNQDVGGPGIVNGKLAGVISFGSPACGTPDAPTVFTKLGFYNDWIEEIMEQDVPHFKKRTTLKEYYTVTLPPIHKITMTTRYIIPPLGKQKNMQPTQISELRTEETIFKEFLKTMFGSREVDEYMESEKTKDIVEKMVEHYNKDNRNDYVDDDQGKTENKKKIALNKNLKRQKKLDNEAYDWVHVTKSPLDYPYSASDKLEIEYTDNVEDTVNLLTTKQAYELKGFVSNDDEVPETVEEVTENPAKYTVMDKTLLKEDEKHLEADIVKLIDNIQLEKLIENEESSDESDIENDTINVNRGKNQKIVDDSVLTLLYLSDKEKSSNGKNDELDEDGMSIPVENFQDWTYRNNANGTTILDLLPQEDLFDLLTEAIKKDESVNKLNKHYISFKYWIPFNIFCDKV